QVEGLQRVDILQRKLAFQFPHIFIKSVLGSGAWRFQRDLGGMKSPIRGPCFENPQHTDCTGVCRPFYRVLTIVLGSTPADRIDILQRKLAFQFPHIFIKSVLGSGAWRFQRDLGGMKSPIRGPCFENPQHT
ncbi:unnamed protein product, partial [Staurois parvus]